MTKDRTKKPTQDNKPPAAKIDTEEGSGSKRDIIPQGPPDRKQLIDEKGEEYLRESANIEDMPNPEEEQEADDAK